MNEKMTFFQQEVYDRIIADLLSLPWYDRKKVYERLAHNDVFCVHCGFGELDNREVVGVPSQSRECQYCSIRLTEHSDRPYTRTYTAENLVPRAREHQDR